MLVILSLTVALFKGDNRKPKCEHLRGCKCAEELFNKQKKSYDAERYSRIKGYLFTSDIKVCTGICLADITFIHVEMNMCVNNSTQQSQFL